MPRRRPPKVVNIDQHFKFNERQISAALNEAATNSWGDAFPMGFMAVNGGRVACSICNVTMNELSQAQEHKAGKPHLLRLLTMALQRNKAELVKNKHDVSITSTFDSKTRNGYIDFDVDAGKRFKVELNITNSSEKAVSLVKGVLLRNSALMKIRNLQVSPTNPHEILPGQSFAVSVEIKSKYLGRHMCPIAFSFQEEEAQTRFHILRFLHSCCKDEVVKLLQPTIPYTRPPKVYKREIANEIIDGLRPPCFESELERDLPLAPCPVPTYVKKLLNKGLFSPDDHEDPTEQDQSFRDLVKSELDMENYKDKFSALLHIEEHQMNVDIRLYDMEAAPMTICQENKRLLLLDVPGLAENRPSLLRGDKVFARQSLGEGMSSHRLPEYIGYVHEVRQTSVALGFSEKLVYIFVDNMKFDVRFTYNRHPVKLYHRAVKLATENRLGPVLFPTVEASVAPNNDFQNTRLYFYDRTLETNEPQSRAVRNILAGSSNPAPYIIFGPPGTGKTVTMVEAIKQIWKLCPKANVLACAPSNWAADQITQRLSKHISSGIFRMYAMSRGYVDVPDNIKKCGNVESGDIVRYPSKADLMKNRIIVCTLTTAGRLVSAVFPEGHFSHVFIDEAGYAVEPEAVTPIAGIVKAQDKNKCGQVVLCGDPRHLGPVVRSPIAIKFGLRQSLLERMMNTNPIYGRSDANGSHDNQNYDSRFITKLVNSYRSHPDILRLPNEMFYHNELRCAADVALREVLCNWDRLPKKGFPLILHGVIGRDMREERSPSFFNPEEVSLVKDYVKALLNSRGGVKITADDIGIIAPYRKQVQKIRGVMIGSPTSKNIKVGSVEEFQGQERKVIIVSTVRSDPKETDFDMKYNLGFLKNEKRFNVALTRAKALLIVIGNPFLLQSDPTWSRLVHFMMQNNAYTGDNTFIVHWQQNTTGDSVAGLDDSELNDLIQNLEDLGLKDQLERGVGTSDVHHMDEPSVFLGRNESGDPSTSNRAQAAAMHSFRFRTNNGTHGTL